MTQPLPPTPQSPPPDPPHRPRGFMDWLFGRRPTPPNKHSPNDYIGDTVDGDFSSPSAHHHHNHHRSGGSGGGPDLDGL